MDTFYLIFFNLDKSGWYYNNDTNRYCERVREGRNIAKFLNLIASKNGNGKVEIEEDRGKLYIITSELTFIFVFLNLWSIYCGKVLDDKKDPYFVLGNSWYAFSNNHALKCYVPSLRRGFKSESVAVHELGDDTSFSPILQMQIYTFDDLIESIEKGSIQPSRLWSPFEDPYFFTTDDKATNSSRKHKYKTLLLKREESKKVLVYKLLNIIKDKIGITASSSNIICSGADSMPVIIDPSKISAIVPESNPWNLITAKIIIPNVNVIHVDLQSFVKELSGFELSDYQLPESINEQSLDENTINFKEDWEAAEELTKRFVDYEIHKLQESDHSETNDSGHFDPDTASDDVDEIFDPDATFDDDEDDVFHREDDEEEGK